MAVYNNGLKTVPSCGTCSFGSDTTTNEIECSVIKGTIQKNMKCRYYRESQWYSESIIDSMEG